MKKFISIALGLWGGYHVAAQGTAPAARYDHTAVWTGTEMIVWGGTRTGLGIFNTGGRYNAAANTWTEVPTNNPPLLRIFLTNASTAVIAWPAPSIGWALQANTNLATTNWVADGGTVNLVGSENQVTVSPLISNRFYRLKSP